MEGLDQEIDLTLRLGLPNQPQENQEAPQGLVPQRNFYNIPRFYHQAIGRSGILPNAEGNERNTSLGRLVNHRPWPLRALELVRNNWNMYSNSLLLRRYQQHRQQQYQKQHQQLRCKICESTETPLWRKGPDGPRTLCNRCGLQYARTLKRG